MIKLNEIYIKEREMSNHYEGIASPKLTGKEAAELNKKLNNNMSTEFGKKKITDVIKPVFHLNKKEEVCEPEFEM